MTLLRPSDHFDTPEPDKDIVQPRLGFVGYIRFFWRQLTSMRTALFLLLLLAFAAIPGSIVPQQTADPNGVVLYKVQHPVLYPILDFLQAFNTYGSVWFSAIYLLLFVSLIGCVIPRAIHHARALRSRPPRTPARLERMAGFTTSTVTTGVEETMAAASALLKRSGYRVQRYPSTSSGRAAESISAERGYLRETGNLVFHIALVGILITIGIGGSVGYTGQRIIVVGQKFVNTIGDYDTFTPGRAVNTDALSPYRVVLDKFDVSYQSDETQAAYGQPTDYTAHVTTTEDGVEKKQILKVNSPLDIGGTQAYLLGNGYAPVITVKNPAGQVVWSDSVPFLPQDALLTSLGVIKVPDGLSKQLGFTGFFYPTAQKLSSGAYASSYPGLKSPLLSLQVYSGDLGLDNNVPRSVYSLDVTHMKELAGIKDSLKLTLGKVVNLPDGLGTIEMTSVKRYISLDVHHDPTQGYVLFFAVFVVAGLLTGLFVPRRRIWVKAVTQDGGDIRLEYAGLARGEDPNLEGAVADIASRLDKQLELPTTRLKVDS